MATSEGSCMKVLGSHWQFPARRPPYVVVVFRISWGFPCAARSEVPFARSEAQLFKANRPDLTFWSSLGLFLVEPFINRSFGQLRGTQFCFEFSGPLLRKFGVCADLSFSRARSHATP